MPEPTDEEFRHIGFTGAARNYPRSELAFKAFCAFVNVDPAKASETIKYAPNESCQKAWERVVKAIQEG